MPSPTRPARHAGGAAPLLVLALALALAGPASAQAPDPARLVEVPLDDPRSVALALDLDVAGVDRARGVLQVVARADDLATLRGRGVVHVVVQDDLSAFYASRLSPLPAPVPGLGSLVDPPFGQGAMGGYYTFSQIVAILDQLTAQFPAITTPKTSLGTSVEGRDLWAIKISDAPGVDEDEPEVRLDALHHAREPMSMHASLWFVLWLLDGYGSDPLATWLVDERELWFVPVVNPDGYVHNETTDPGGGGLWRKNRRDNGDGTFGVDLNRNYPFAWGIDDLGSSPDTSSEVYRGPAPQSEPETQAMVAFLSSRGFRSALSVHSFSNLWLSPWGYTFADPPQLGQLDEIGQLATAVNGYPAGPASQILYLANGSTIDEDFGQHGTFSWTPEIGSSSDGFWPPTDRIVPLAEENLVAIRRTVLAAGAWTYLDGVELVEVGDGDGAFEPGESVELDVTVRNSGRDATTGPVTLTLSTDDDGATVTAGSASLGTVAPFTSVATAPGDLALALSPSAQAGDVVTLDLELAYEGLVQPTTTTIALGTPRLLVADDVEVDLGWTAGVPGDGATTGLWELASPIGTTDGGEPVAPGSDATPGAGVLAFVTGNGGGAAGTDDVDDGATTLLSPLLDLGGLQAARLGYQRWWADLGGAQDDVFEIDLSNDGGQTWTPLETVGPTQNAWTAVSLPLHETLPLTDAMQVRFVASDDPNNSLVEAGIDELTLEIWSAAPRLIAYGSGELGTPVRFAVGAAPGDDYSLLFSPATGNLPIPGIDGVLGLDLDLLFTLVEGTIPPSSSGATTLVLPADPGLAGVTVYLQALVAGDSGKAFSNVATLVLE